MRLLRFVLHEDKTLVQTLFRDQRTLLLWNGNRNERLTDTVVSFLR